MYGFSHRVQAALAGECLKRSRCFWPARQKQDLLQARLRLLPLLLQRQQQ